MIPLFVKPAAAAGALLLAIAVGAAAGWGANGWRLGAQIAELKTEAASKEAKAATDALADLEAGMKRVTTSARAAAHSVTSVSAKLDQIQLEKNHVPPPPLPPDCRPDAVRVHSLASSAAAVDEAITRSKPGGAVQAERPAGRAR